MTAPAAVSETRPRTLKNPIRPAHEAGVGGLLTRLGLTNFALWLALLTPIVVTLALRIGELDPEHKARSLGIVNAVSSVVALIANPLSGMLSDATQSRFGRRLPWLVGGAVVGLVGLAVVATAPNIGVLLVGWCVVQFAYNAALSSLNASVPEQVPAQSRGRASGVFGLTRTVGLIAGTGLIALFAGHTLAQFLVPALLLVAAVALLAPSLARGPRPAAAGHVSMRSIFACFRLDRRNRPEFARFWVVRFCMVLGGVIPLTYLVYYLPDRLGVSTGAVAGSVFVFTTASAAVTAVVSAAGGWLSDHWGQRRRVFLIGACVLNASALGLFAITHSFGVALAAQALLGAGNGLYFAVDLAIVSQVLPDPTTIGKDMGVVNIANTLPQSVAPAFAPLLIAVGGYATLYVFGALAIAVGAVLATRLRTVR